MLFQLIAYTGFIILLFVTVFYGANYKLLNHQLKLIFLFLIAIVIIESINKYLWIKKENNLFTAHLYGYLEFLILAPFFFRSYKRHLIFFLSFSLFVVGMLIYGSYKYTFYEYNVTGIFAVKFFIIIASLRELYSFFFNTKHHYFYINLALLLSGIMGLTLFSFGNVLSKFPSDTQKILWVINGIVFIAVNLLLGINLYRYKHGR